MQVGYDDHDYGYTLLSIVSSSKSTIKRNLYVFFKEKSKSIESPGRAPTGKTLDELRIF